MPLTWGLVPPTQAQVGRTPHKPALPATQPRAPPAMPKGPPGWGSPEQWGLMANEPQPPKGPDLRHPTPSEETQMPYLLRQLTGDLGKRANRYTDIELVRIARPPA